jgi:flagellar motor switch protein FliN/FliY
MQIAPQLSQALTKAASEAATLTGLGGSAEVIDGSWKPSPGAVLVSASIADPIGGRLLLIVQGVEADINVVFDTVATTIADSLGVVIEDAAAITELPPSVAVITGVTAGTSTVAVGYATAVNTPVKNSAGEAIHRLNDVEMTVTAELGRARLTVRDILGMVPGKVVELDKIAGSPIDLLVNGKLVARGEVVVIDEEFGVRVTEIVGDEF